MYHLMRMARLARHPPSAKTVKMVLGVLAFVAILWGIEAMFGWPEWLTPDGNFSRRGF